MDLFVLLSFPFVFYFFFVFVFFFFCLRNTPAPPQDQFPFDASPFWRKIDTPSKETGIEFLKVLKIFLKILERFMMTSWSEQKQKPTQNKVNAVFHSVESILLKANTS